ncbi:UNVERIFIED_ORG: hypothetical protein ABIC54_001627 [Burkholderia sp. 1263]|jgi:hypothetical protein
MTKKTSAAPLGTRQTEGVKVSVADLAADIGASPREVIKALAVCQDMGFLDIRAFDGLCGTFKVKLPQRGTK